MPRRFLIRSRNCLPTTSVCDDREIRPGPNCYRLASDIQYSRISACCLPRRGTATYRRLAAETKSDVWAPGACGDRSQQAVVVGVHLLENAQRSIATGNVNAAKAGIIEHVICVARLRLRGNHLARAGIKHDQPGRFSRQLSVVGTCRGCGSA